MTTTTQATSNLMAGKKGLIMGVANDRSIAWGIAKTAHAHGAEVMHSRNVFAHWPMKSDQKSFCHVM